MKKIIKNIKSRFLIGSILTICLLLSSSSLIAQKDSASTTPELPAKVIVKPVKYTFNGSFIIDNQSVMVLPVKGTFEMVIQHRFGTINKGYDDMWGLFAPANMRLGVNYSPIKNLNIGGGLIKSNLIWDIDAKYALIKQTPGKYPVSISYYTNMSFDTRKNVDSSLFKYNSQRYLFFNQIIIARKINERLSIQVAPSVSHQNAVDGYYTKKDSTGTATFQAMKFNHFAIAVSAKYNITTKTSLLIDYNQPLTNHNINNPCPSLGFGAEMHTSGHTFQIFFTNYYFLSPQRNNLYNQNAPFNYTKDDKGTTVQGGKFLLGFNITRLW